MPASEKMHAGFLKRSRGMAIAAGLLFSCTQIDIFSSKWFHTGITTAAIGIESVLFVCTEGTEGLKNLYKYIISSPFRILFILWPFTALLFLITGFFEGWMAFSREWLQSCFIFIAVPFLFVFLRKPGNSMLSGPVFIKCLWAGFIVSTGYGLYQYMSLELGPALFSEAVNVSGFFPNRNIYGGFICLVLPVLTLDLIEKKGGRLIKMPAFIVLALSFLTVLNAGLLFAACFGVAYVLYKKGLLFRVLCWSAGLFLLLQVGTGLYWCAREKNIDLDIIVQSGISETFQGFSHSELLYDSISLSGRQGNVRPFLIEHDAALHVIMLNPLFGRGKGGYQEAVNSSMMYPAGYHPEKEAEEDRHSFWLVTGVEGGVVAVICIFGLIMGVWTGMPGGRGTGIKGALAAFVICSFFTAVSVRGPEIIIGMLLSGEDSS